MQTNRYAQHRAEIVAAEWLTRFTAAAGLLDAYHARIVTAAGCYRVHFRVEMLAIGSSAHLRDNVPDA